MLKLRRELGWNHPSSLDKLETTDGRPQGLLIQRDPRTNLSWVILFLKRLSS